MDWSPPGSSVRGILQARTLEWVAASFSKGIFPTQESNPRLLPWQADSLSLSRQGNPVCVCGGSRGSTDVTKFTVVTMFPRAQFSDAQRARCRVAIATTHVGRSLICPHWCSSPLNSSPVLSAAPARQLPSHSVPPTRLSRAPHVHGATQGLPCPACLTSPHSVFSVHPCWSRHQNSLPL